MHIGSAQCSPIPQSASLRHGGGGGGGGGPSGTHTPSGQGAPSQKHIGSSQCSPIAQSASEPQLGGGGGSRSMHTPGHGGAVGSIGSSPALPPSSRTTQ